MRDRRAKHSVIIMIKCDMKVPTKVVFQNKKEKTEEIKKKLSIIVH